jgi:hypothetical protein
MSQYSGIDHSTQSYWDYLSSNQKDLIREGGYLYQEVFTDGKYAFSDYSFIVFPFAKCLEGFLKKIFYDIGFLNEKEYESSHLRLGKLLSPEYYPTNGRQTIYQLISERYSQDLATEVWSVWKKCRNEIFHYFPHNDKKVTLAESKEMIDEILQIMISLVKVIGNNRLQPHGRLIK